MARTLVGLILVAVCLGSSGCEKVRTPDRTTHVIVPKEGSLTKEKDFAEYCVSEENLGVEQTQRCRDELEVAESDRKKGVK